MTYFSVPLGVRRGPEAKGASPSKAQTEKTLARDGYACRCCGFESKKFQRVVALATLDPSAKAGDWATVCTFCELTLNLERAGLGGAGFLVWMPELTQAELNNIVRALYIARESQEQNLSKAAIRTLEVLTARRAEAKKRLGTDDPLLLATAFFEQLDDKAYAARGAKLDGIRLLPLDRYLVQQRGGKDVNVFPQMLAFWTSAQGPYGSIQVDAWQSMFETVSGKAKEEAV